MTEGWLDRAERKVFFACITLDDYSRMFYMPTKEEVKKAQPQPSPVIKEEVPKKAEEAKKGGAPAAPKPVDPAVIAAANDKAAKEKRAKELTQLLSDLKELLGVELTLDYMEKQYKLWKDYGLDTGNGMYDDEKCEVVSILAGVFPELFSDK